MKRIIAIIAVLVSAAAAYAQTSISVQAPNLVGVNEQFNVTFVISGDDSPSSFDWEVGSDFQLVWGPQKGSSKSVTIVNGKRTTSSQTTYTYILLPKNTGKFQLPAAEAVVKGETYTSKRQTIEVVSDGASAQQGGQQSQGTQSRTSDQSSSVSGEDMFLRLTFSKTRVMVGEPVTATLKLYQRVNIAGFEDARFPTFNGFWSQEVQAPQNIEFQRESVGDKIYNAAVLRSWNLVPQQAGDITVDPAELVCLVRVRNPHASTGSIFDSFFQDDYQTIRKRVSTSPVTMTVRPLPAGAPASFGGGVGKFSMNASLTRDSLKTHDAASLKVTVTGSGNVSLLDAPKISFPVDFEVYDVKTTDVQGGKQFEYPFIPRSYGEFTIGPVEYSYYDISAGKYVTLSSQPLEISVGKSNGESSSDAGQVVNPGVVRKDVRDLGTDIRFISTKTPRFVPSGSFFVGSAVFWIVTALLFVLAAAAYHILRRISERRADVAGSKNRGASRMARKRLSQAGVFLEGNLYSAFYEELHKALLGFVSDKFNMDASELSKDNIRERLVSESVPAGLADDFTGLVDACEFARYAPDAGHDAMNAHYEKAVSVISSIDSCMKRSNRSGAGLAVVAALLLMAPATMRAADNGQAEEFWKEGVAAYADGQWNTAIEKWNAVCGLSVESEELYYNLGNAYFKNDDMAHAILFYEKCLKLNPSNSDARYNLEFANTMIQDKIEVVPEFFLGVVARKICWILKSDAWAWLFLLLIAASLACVLLFLLGGTRTARKTGFIAGIVSVVLAAFSISFAFWQRSDYRRADDAIVTRAVTSVKSSPGSDSAKDLFILHEGTKVKVLDEVGQWRNVELSDGRQGWMLASEIEVI